MASNSTLAGLPQMGIDEVPIDYMRALIHGPQGGGKTTLASTIAECGPTLYVDLVGEKGIRSFAGAPYAGNITVIRPSSVNQFDDIFYALDSGDAKDKAGRPYVAVCVDSLTSVQKMAMRFQLGHSETAVREIQKGSSPADQRTWGQTLDIMTDFATFWYGLADGNRKRPMHVVFTAQTKMIEDELGGVASRSPDVQRGAMQIVKAAPDFILYAETEQNYELLDPVTNEATVRHIVRFGSHPGYSTKARIPVPLRGKIPAILGRGKNAPNLTSLARNLGMGGVPAIAKPVSSAPAA